MKGSFLVKNALVLGASLLSLALPASALAGNVTVASDSSWKVYVLNPDGTRGLLIDLAQNVCLNATNPTNCPLSATPAPTVYGYSPNGWTANLSSLPTSARWIWAPNVTGTSTPAALQGFIFETQFYMCDPPLGGRISVAVDDSAEVWLNGTLVSNSMSTSHSSLKTVNVDASSLFGSSLLNGLRPNSITVKARNAANPADCGSDQYSCNPAGVILGATLDFSGDPPCPGDKGGTYTNGQSEEVSKCRAGETGSVYHTCVCGQWTPDVNTCRPLPPTCTDNNITYSVGDPAPVSCPPDRPNGMATRTCVAKDTWGTPDYSQCRPSPTTCRGNGGTIFAVGQQEDVGPCPAPRTSGTRFRTCKPDGTWDAVVDTCRLPEVCAGAPPGECICGSSQVGQTGLCPSGVDCGSRRESDILMSTDWYCGRLPPAVLGAPCVFNGACGSGYCDRGNGTSRTDKCMPRAGTGNINDPCSNNNQCASGRCGGLRQDVAGAWHPGHCSNSPSALGEFCSVNSDCTSTYCDRGNGTSKTSMCMPRGGTGARGDWCSHDNQCSSRVCGGLQPLAGGAWQPGHCN